MSSIKWSGIDVKELEHAIVARTKQIEIDARQILEDISHECVDEMHKILVNATTKTGEYRAAAGVGSGIAGRVDTGQMSRDITRSLDAGLDGEVVLTWGWVENVEDYYLYQEYGTERIGAMSALQQTYMKAREKLRERFQDMGLEVT